MLGQSARVATHSYVDVAEQHKQQQQIKLISSLPPHPHSNSSGRLTLGVIVIRSHGGSLCACGELHSFRAVAFCQLLLFPSSLPKRVARLIGHCGLTQEVLHGLSRPGCRETVNSEPCGTEKEECRSQSKRWKVKGEVRSWEEVRRKG